MKHLIQVREREKEVLMQVLEQLKHESGGSATEQQLRRDLKTLSSPGRINSPGRKPLSRSRSLKREQNPLGVASPRVQKSFSKSRSIKRETDDPVEAFGMAQLQHKLAKLERKYRETLNLQNQQVNACRLHGTAQQQSPASKSPRSGMPPLSNDHYNMSANALFRSFQRVRIAQSPRSPAAVYSPSSASATTKKRWSPASYSSQEDPSGSRSPSRSSRDSCGSNNMDEGNNLGENGNDDFKFEKHLNKPIYHQKVEANIQSQGKPTAEACECTCPVVWDTVTRKCPPYRVDPGSSPFGKLRGAFPTITIPAACPNLESPDTYGNWEDDVEPSCCDWEIEACEAWQNMPEYLPCILGDEDEDIDTSLHL